jgi:PEP-CTERM motif
MRNVTRLMLGAACVVSAPASAATFFFNSGSYNPGVTAPEPLQSPDTLEMNTSSNKLFSGVTFTNQSGTVNWNAGNIFLASAVQIINQSLWNATGDNSLNYNGGAQSTFDTSGIFRKSGGIGATTIASIAFVNSGTIDAQTGSIDFNGGNATFNGGSIFTGAGEVNINSNAAFNGGFTSSNLDFQGGAFTGTNAALTGTADFSAGTFAGSWTVGAGSTLNALGSSNKLFSAANFTNDGTVAWSAGNQFFASGSQIDNNGLWDASGDNSLNYNGGTQSTFTNDGTFRKSAGGGSTTIASIAFVNNGTIDAQTGSITFGGGIATFNAGSIFTGAGEVNITNNAAFNGGFTSSNLDFEGGTFTGTNAALTGTADWTAGTFAGSWNVNSGSNLAISGSANKLLSAATFGNDGTIAWSAGNMFLASGSQLINDGLIAITGDNSVNYNGGAASSFVNNGTIEKTAGSGTTTLATSNIALDNNGTINVLSGTIALPGTFANDGTLGGTGTFTSANLTNNGIIAPGAPGATGMLSLTGNYFQSGSGALNTQLASTGSFDFFRVSGNAQLNGTLNLSCILGCAINTGDSFVILKSFGALAGTFSNVTTNGFLNGFSYSVIYDYAGDNVRLDILNKGTAPPNGAVPEPSTWMMLLAGFGIIGSAIRRRRSATPQFA